MLEEEVTGVTNSPGFIWVHAVAESVTWPCVSERRVTSLRWVSVEKFRKSKQNLDLTVHLNVLCFPYSSKSLFLLSPDEKCAFYLKYFFLSLSLSVCVYTCFMCVFLYHTGHLSFWGSVPHWTWNSPFWLGWPPNSQHPSLSILARHPGVKRITAMASIYTGARGLNSGALAFMEGILA